MTGNKLVEVQAKVLTKNTISMRVEVNGKTGYLKLAVIELLKDFNSINQGDVVPMRVPEWHLISAKLIQNKMEKENA